MLFIGSHHSKNHQNSLKGNDAEEMEFNITSITDPREVINVINHYEDIMKTQNKNMWEQDIG